MDEKLIDVILEISEAIVTKNVNSYHFEGPRNISEGWNDSLKFLILSVLLFYVESRNDKEIVYQGDLYSLFYYTPNTKIESYPIIQTCLELFNGIRFDLEDSPTIQKMLRNPQQYHFTLSALNEFAKDSINLSYLHLYLQSTVNYFVDYLVQNNNILRPTCVYVWTQDSLRWRVKKKM